MRKKAPVSVGSRAPKTSEVLAARLVERIIVERLPTGYSLENEHEMSERYGVGRVTIREALRILENRRVIIVKPGFGGGPIVRRPTPADLQDGLSLMLQFQGASLRDVMSARLALEPMMAFRAATRVQAAELDALQSTVDAIVQNLDDHPMFLEQNAAFHQGIADACGLPVFSVFSGSLQSLADGHEFGITYSVARRRRVAESHQTIIDALRAGSEEDAQFRMHEHLEEALEYWSKMFSLAVEGPISWIRY